MVLIVAAALAGEGDADLHGPVPPPPAADPAIPTRTWSVDLVGERAAGLGLEVGTDVLTLVEDEAGVTTGTEVIGTVALARLGGIVSLGELALAADLPLAWTEGDRSDGLALGDLSLAAPVALPGRRWAVIPTARLSTGPRGHGLSDPKGGVGMLFAGTSSLGPLRGSGNLGLAWHGVDWDLVPELEVPFAASLGWLAAPSLGLHAEVVGGWRPGMLPIEVSLGGRYARGDTFASIALGTGLTGDPSAADVRLLATAGWSFPVAERPVPEGPRIVVEVPPPAEVAAPVPVVVRARDVRGEVAAAEVVLRSGTEEVRAEPGEPGTWSASIAPGAWTVEVSAPGLGAQRRDLVVTAPLRGGRAEPLEIEAVLLDDGGDGELTLSLTDLEARPVVGRLLVDGLPAGSTSTGGTLTLADLAPGPHRVEVDAHGFRPAARTVEVGAVAAEVAVVMPPVVGAVRVVALGPDGPVGDATVAFEGAARRPPVSLGPTGERTMVLGQGRWTAVVASSALGLQTRELVLSPEDRGEARIEVVFLPREGGTAELDLRLVDPSGAPVVGAAVSVDDRPVGRTATGGAMALRDLSPGGRRVRVEVPGARPVDRTVWLDEGAREEVVVVRWNDGAARVTVGTPSGPVGDAVISGRGPVPLAPFEPGADGEAVIELAPGDWTLVAASEAAGLETRRVTVPAGGERLVPIEFLLEPAGSDEGLAELSVRVRDPGGTGVDGAEVLLDGARRGTTVGGRVDLASLVPGRRVLGARAAGLSGDDRPVQLAPGPQEVALDLRWSHAVGVAVVGPGGEPVTDAVVRLFGPAGASSPAAVAADGTRVLPAAPGTWQVVVTSVAQGLATGTVEVPQGAGLVPARIRVGRSGGSDVLVYVQDPLGQPVPSAAVACEGCPQTGPATGGAVLVAGLGAGEATLDVTAPHFRPRRVEATLREGDEQRVVRLDPLPTAVVVAVTDEAGRPLDADVRLVGPYEVPAVDLGADGEAEVALLPGRWEVTAEAAGLRAQRADLELRPGDPAARVELRLTPAKVSVQAGEVVIEEQVHFDLGSAALRPESTAILREVADTLVAHAEVLRLEVQGHTDPTGEVATNQRLSQERAEVVRAALVGLGVAPERLVARGYGPTRPVADNADEAGRARNRRVQFAILEE